MVHLTGEWWIENITQGSGRAAKPSVFCHSSASVYYTECKLMNKNGGDLGTRLSRFHWEKDSACDWLQYYNIGIEGFVITLEFWLESTSLFCFHSTESSGVAKLGHTGARALETRGCVPPVQACLKIIGAKLNVPLSITNQALKMHKCVYYCIAICILRITRSRMLPWSHSQCMQVCYK